MAKQIKSYSLDDKIMLCREWQQTGLSRNKFIKQKGLPGSFHEWCNNLIPQLPLISSTSAVIEPNRWLEIVPKDIVKTHLENKTDGIDFKLRCNNLELKFCMPMDRIISFVKELNNATSIIR